MIEMDNNRKKVKGAVGKVPLTRLLTAATEED